MAIPNKSISIPSEIRPDFVSAFRAVEALRKCEGMDNDSYTGFRDGAYELTYAELKDCVRLRKKDVDSLVSDYNQSMRCSAINSGLSDDFTRKEILRNVVTSCITPCCIRINWNADSIDNACSRINDPIRINDAAALCAALEKDDIEFDTVNSAVERLYNAVMKKASNEARGAKDQETGMKAAVESIHEVFGIFLRKADIRLLCNKVAELEKAHFNKEGIVVSNKLKRVTMQDFEAILLQVLRNAFYSDSYEVNIPNKKSITVNKSMILKAIGKGIEVKKPEEQKAEEQKAEEQKAE